MRSEDLFVKTLKRIGYQKADSLSESDFNALTSEELKPFFEVFFELDETNVLTTEEIEAYSALTPADIAETELLKNNDEFDDTGVEQEKKKEAYFLQEQLAVIENHNKVLEKQYDLLKKREENILQEKEKFQKLLSDAKKQFKSFEITKVPLTEEKLVSSLKSCVKITKDLESIFQNCDNNDYKSPTSNSVKDSIQQYVKDENNVLQCINSYMQTEFELLEDGSFSFIHNEVLHQKKLGKEVSFIKKKLKSSILNNVMSEITLCKTKSILKYFETVAVSNIYQCSSSQIRLKIDDSITLNEKLKKKEESYQTHMCNAIFKHVDALVAELVFYASKEMIDSFQFYIRKMSLPKKYLIWQRLRTEKLIASLNEHMDTFQNLKKIFQKILKQMKEEQLCLDNRQVEIENELNDITQNQDGQLPAAILLSSLHNILASSEEFNLQDMPKPSIDYVLQTVKKLCEVEENFKEIYAENVITIDSMENQAKCLETLLYSNKKYSDWQDLEQSFNRDLNYLVMKSNSFIQRMSECNKDLEEKQKLLEKRKNLQLARQLFVYALTNRILFEKCIKEINFAAENSTE